MRGKHLLRWLIVVLCLALAGWPPAAPPARAQSDQPYVEGQLIVRFRQDIPEMLAASIRMEASLQAIESNDTLDLQLVGVEAGRETQLITELSANPLVEYVGYNYIAHIAGEPNDTAWWRQWNLTQVGSPTAWDITTGSNLIIAIVDTGVDLTHPDLAGKLVEGHDFLENDNQPTDDHGHGTHVAGIAAAASNNRLGIAGMSWGARIMPLKVMNAKGDGSYYDIISAIQYAADHGARVINLSLGGYSADTNLQVAVAYARNKGCLVLAAAGNQGGSLLYPAAYAESFSVAATNDSSQRPSYSNSGAGVDIAAPGGTQSVGIYSLAPGGGYKTMYGTSMSTPMVSGLAALIWSLSTDLTPSQVEAIIEETASKVGSDAYNAAGWNDKLGHGQIDAPAALRRAIGQTVPTATPTRTPTPPRPTPTPTIALTTQTITLRAGWNLISINVIPPNGNIATLTADIRSDLETVLGFQCSAGGLSYYPDLPPGLSTLQTIDAGRGYWIRMSGNRQWSVSGTPIYPQAPLSLCKGWNLAGYLPTQSSPLPGALATLGDAFDAALGFQNGQALSYYTSLPPYLNTLQRMEPGAGYWISANRPAILTYPQP